MKSLFDYTKIYRLPWNLADNASTWLEVTTACDLKCLGCYRENTGLHKKVQELEKELELIKKLRKTDSIAIAGGEPLLHPDLEKIVFLIKKKGWKPCLVTNGNVISEDILTRLKKAGLYKISFHVDSRQNRPGWENKNESELNLLRRQYAELVKRIGGISCNFIATIYPETLNEIGDIVLWAKKNIALVNALHFTCHRAASYDCDYFVNGEKVDIAKTAYLLPKATGEKVDVFQIVDKFREIYPDLEPCAYLNGTEKADSVKWLFSGIIGNDQEVYGYIGSAALEFVQSFYHFFKGRYFSTLRPSRFGIWSWLSWMWIFDYLSRQALRKYFKKLSFPPQNLYLQMISVVQPIDILPDGRQDMCDGCPDQTIWRGELVYSCRLDEYLKFGCLCNTCFKEKVIDRKD